MNSANFALEARQVKKNVGDAYLKLQLEQQTLAVLPMQYAQEAIVVPARRITPMPNMPACVIGLLNQRSRILWVVDLPQMLGLQPIDRKLQNYNVAIVKVGQLPLALAIGQIKGVIRFSIDIIQSPIGTVSEGLTPYLRGLVMQEKEILLVLEPEAIVNSSILNRHRASL
jgi:twitching motility protein PilI